MSISQFILNAHEHELSEFLVRSRWMVRIRWFYILLLTIAAVPSTYFVTGDLRKPLEYAGLSAVGWGLNLLALLTLRIKRETTTYYTIHALLQIMIDMLCASGAMYLLGGVSARATILYALPIFTAGILLRGYFAYFAAFMSSLGYMVCLFLYVFYHRGAYRLEDTIIPIVFYSTVFFLLARIVAYFSALGAAAEREASYNQLLAMLRHQLRHPSSAIAAVVDTLENQPEFEKLPARSRELIQQIKRENMSLNAMISNLLVAASPNATPVHAIWETIDLSELVGDTALTCATGAKRVEDLRIKLPKAPVRYRARPDQLRMALNNIIDNAFSYSNAGTPVIVSLRRISRNPDTIRITVKDKGRGITAAQSKQLFQRFTFFEDKKPSSRAGVNMYTSGLGLYVSKLIIDRHGGVLTLTSKPGHGTQVTILFGGKR